MNDTVIKLPNGDFTTTGYLRDHYYKKGYLGPSKGVKSNDYMIIDDRVHQIHKVVVHRFQMGDVEDPDLYAAQPLWDWQQSEMGAWVMKHAVETPEWHRMHDYISYYHRYAVVARLKGVDYTFWTLKCGNDVDKKI